MIDVLGEPLQQNIKLKQRAGSTISITITDRAGNPISNFTGYSVQAQIRNKPTDLVLFEWNTTPGVGLGTVNFTYTPTPAKSTVDLVTTGDQTAALNFWLAGWDCFIRNPAGDESCIGEGTIVIDLATTH